MRSSVGERGPQEDVLLLRNKQAARNRTPCERICVPKIKGLKDKTIRALPALNSQAPQKSVTCKTRLYPQKTQLGERISVAVVRCRPTSCMCCKYVQRVKARDRLVCPGAIQVPRKPYMPHWKQGGGTFALCNFMCLPSPPSSVHKKDLTPHPHPQGISQALLGSP